MDLAMQEIHKCKGEVTALHKIKEMSNKHFKQEICGFLGYDNEKKEFIIQKEDNIATDPRSHFLINPLSYLLFKDSYSMIAVFHSHIIGDETESEFDVKMSDNCCQPFLIYSLNTKKINIYTPETIESDVNILERIKAVK
jgi:proteasome lid subunit RPN8/RPN11